MRLQHLLLALYLGVTKKNLPVTVANHASFQREGVTVSYPTNLDAPFAFPASLTTAYKAKQVKNADRRVKTTCRVTLTL